MMKIFQSKAGKRSDVSPETFEKAALEFERSKNGELRLSRKIAWGVAGVACFIAALSAASAVVANVKREDPRPILVTLDKGTGIAQVRRELDDAPTRFDEAVDKYWLSQYVCKRQGYDWFLISTDYEIVKLMSSDEVGKDYDREVNDKNAPLNVLAEKGKVRCKVISVSFVGSSAQVRYSLERLDENGFNADGSPLFYWMATVAYEYQPGRKMTDKEREANPLGFTTLSYRRDAEAMQ